MRKSILIVLGASLVLWFAGVTNIAAQEPQSRVILGTIQSVEQDSVTGNYVIYLKNSRSFPVSNEARIYDNLDSWPVPYRGRITLIIGLDGQPMVIDIEPRDG